MKQPEVFYHTDVNYQREMRKRSDQKLNGPVHHLLYAEGNMLQKCNITAAFHQSRCATLVSSNSIKLEVVISNTRDFFFLIQGH